MRISARNALPGKIVDIKKGATTAHVRIDVNGTIVTASITNEAVDDLGLKVGDKVPRRHQGVGRDGGYSLGHRSHPRVQGGGLPHAILAR
jgi:molybdopterin-binding protein